MTSNGAEEPELISDSDEVLNRQVPVVLLDSKGKAMKVAFMPTKSDGMMSTLRARVSPQEAYERWQANDETADSAGTWGVSVGEANDLDLPCYDDGGLAGSPPDHASVDFSSIPASPNKPREQVGRKLRDKAELRGALYKPGPS